MDVTQMHSACVRVKAKKVRQADRTAAPLAGVARLFISAAQKTRKQIVTNPIRPDKQTANYRFVLIHQSWMLWGLCPPIT